METPTQQVYIEDLGKHDGQRVLLRGWLYNLRSSGKLHFLEVRDGTGIVQAVVFAKEVAPELFAAAGKLSQETSIEVEGTVRKHPKEGYEVGVSALRVVNVPTAEYPISPKEHGVAFLMDHRHLWLRSKRQHAILRIRAEIVRAVRDFFDGRGFTLVDAPIFTPSACEGTSNLFEVGYFDQKAFLTQSGQLYMEAAAMALGKVYCFGPTFRAEKSKTRRHLTEFWMVEPEVAYMDLAGDMQLAEDFICFIVQRVLERRRPELAVLERDVAKLENIKPPFPRITYEEALEILKAGGKDVPFGEDFGGDEETVISEKFDRPVLIHRYPRAIKAFYMKTDPADARLALNVDVIAPEGYGEIIGGGQREDDLAVLEDQIKKHELPREAFEWFLDLRRYGSVPHAGFGLGIERTVSWLCGLHHVRETIPFPRMLERLTRSSAMASGESQVGAQLRTWLSRALCLGFAGWLSYLALRFGSRAVADDAVAWAGQGGVMLVVLTGLIGWWLVRRRVTFTRVLMAPSGAAFIGGAFALALVTGLCAHYLLLHGVPDVPDELGYLHQARSFADGWLAAPSPPLEEFHYASWATHDAGSWYAVFPPGYGVLLGLGVQGGVPGLVNPLLGALLCLVLFELGKELFGGDGALPRLAVLLYLASWFRMLHAGSLMAHPTAALATGVALLGVLRGVGATQPGRRALAWAAAAGAAGAALLATRPLNAVLLAVALLPVVIARVAARPRPALRGLLHVVVAAAPLLLAYGAYDRALTGSALLTPQQRYMQLKEARKDCFRLGFGPGVGQCPITQNSNFGPEGFQLHDAKNNTARRLSSLQRDLFAIAPLGWLPILGLFGGALGAAAAARRRALYGWMGLVTILGYGLFFYHGVAYGARFYYELLPAAALLAAAALGDLGALPARLPPGRVRGWLAGLGGALAWSLPAILVVALLAGFARVAPNGKRARTDDGRTLEVIRRAGPDAIVFVDSMVVPAAMLLHPAALGRGRPLVVADLGDAANAGYLRTPQARGRRPFRLVAGTLVPQTYAADAPVRHEAGNKYPLQVAHGGFGDRVGAGPAGGNPVSGGELLRFRLGVSEPVPRGGAWFGFPIWVAPEDAGALTVHIEAIATAQSPRLGFAVDGASLGPWQDTNASKPTPRPIDLPATLTAGPHWLTVRADGQTGTVLLDYVELRPAARR